MIPFDEIDARLTKLGKDRAWLANNTPYSKDYIRTVLAPNSTRRTPRVMAVLSDAIEREEQAAETAAPAPVLPDRITIEVPPSTMKRWDAAAKAHNETTREWAITELNRAAEAWHTMQIKVAEPPPDFGGKAGNGGK